MLITTTRTIRPADKSRGPGIFGNLKIDGNHFKCLTMEREGVEIPVGVYPITWVWSPHFDQIMPQIIVPERVMILQHWANWPDQLDGCQALGFSQDLHNDMLMQSKDAWKAYIEIILNQPSLTLKVVEDFA